MSGARSLHSTPTVPFIDWKMTTNSLSPTYYGYISSTHDALLVIEASLQGTLNPVLRRPNDDNERERLVTSGCVIVYDNRSSGIKRWTDGKLWSSSRIRGGFLIYHEVQDDCHPREKRRGRKSTKAAVARKGKPRNMLSNIRGNFAGPPIEPSCLIKKCMSVKAENTSYSLISYYTTEDVSKLTKPSNNPQFQNIRPRSALTTNQNFKSADEADMRGSMIQSSVREAYLTQRNVAVPDSTHSQFLTPYVGPQYGIYGATPRQPPVQPPPVATSPPWIPHYGRNNHGLHDSHYRYSLPARHGMMGGYFPVPPHDISGILSATNRIGQYVDQHRPWINEGKPI